MKNRWSIDQTRLRQAFVQAQLAFDDRDRTRAPGDAAILSRLGHILVNPKHASLGDTQHAVSGSVIRDDKGDLFGRPEAGEKS